MDRIFGLDLQTVFDAFLMMFNIFILFAALSYLLFEPVKAMLEKRSEKIKNDIDTAALEKEDAIILKKEYEEKIRNVQKESDEILSNARKKAIKREEEIINEAKKEAARIIEQAKVEVALEKEKAKDDIKKEMISIATLMAGKFVAASIDNSIQNSLIEETLQEMGDKTWLN